MARWLLAEPTSLLLDPGCGSGSLLAAAAEERTETKTRLLGLDIDQLAIERARSTCAVRGIQHAVMTARSTTAEDHRTGGGRPPQSEISHRVALDPRIFEQSEKVKRNPTEKLPGN